MPGVGRRVGFRGLCGRMTGGRCSSMSGCHLGGGGGTQTQTKQKRRRRKKERKPPSALCRQIAIDRLPHTHVPISIMSALTLSHVFATAYGARPRRPLSVTAYSLLLLGRERRMPRSWAAGLHPR